MNADVVVVGAGIAGCTAALAASKRGANVVLMTKLPEPSESNTRYAQGGIIYTAPDDSPELLVEDVISAGDGEGSREAAMLLATEGPTLVGRLLIDELDVPFDRDRNGQLLLTREGAHSVARIVHHKDSTGDAIQTSLTRAVSDEPLIQTILDAEVTELLTLNGECVGVRATIDGEQATIHGNVVLATGGLCALYSHSTNPPSATGDGIALAMRAGAAVRDLRYIQFHPTVLYDPHPDRRGFLISEAVRGEGATLEDPDGNTFIQHPLDSLAPRDVVTREIVAMIQDKNTKCAFLNATCSVTGRPAGWFGERFPAINARCIEAGIDPDLDRIPVVPAAHYTCGGVVSGLTGRTSVSGLWAAGEVASTGLHGANRLASTSLLEGLVWGWRAGEDAAGDCAESSASSWTGGIAEHREVVVAPESVWEELYEIMSEKAGILRDADGLEAGLSEVVALQEGYADTDIAGALEVAAAVIRDALENHRSRGCHYRMDDPSVGSLKAEGHLRVGG